MHRFLIEHTHVTNSSKKKKKQKNQQQRIQSVSLTNYSGLKVFQIKYKVAISLDSVAVHIE